MAKLNAMLETLRRGKNVQNRQLSTWLTQEVIAWKMDEMNSRITSLQTQQMFNNINLNNSINQQNLYNNNNFITTCPWWDIC